MASDRPVRAVSGTRSSRGLRQILHISDIHFGPHHLDDVAMGVVALANERKPDLVVISGDLTHRAKRGQFAAARAYVDRFDVPTLAVPGNHDVPMYRKFFLERVFQRYGEYQRTFAEDLEPELEDEAMVVIGLNTAFNWTVKDGHVSRRRLLRLEERLGRVADGKAILVVAHHPLIPPPRFDSQRVLGNASELAEVLTRGGVDMVLSGHYHQSWVGSTEAYYPSGRNPVLLVHSGTTTTNRGRGVEKRRNTCNWIRLDPDEVEISHLRWEEPAGAFDEISRHRYARFRRDGSARTLGAF